MWITFLSTGNFIGNEVWNMGKKKSRNRSKNKAVAQSGAVKKRVQVSPASAAAAATAEKRPDPQARKLSVDEEACYSRRFGRHFDELKWLYMELYDNSSMFAELCDNLHRFYEERDLDLKEQDAERRSIRAGIRPTTCWA